MDDRRESAPVNVPAPIVRAYESRLAARQARRDALERQHARLAWSRLAVFAAAGALVAMLGRTSPPWLVIPGLVFVVLLIVHARVLNARDRAARAAAFYTRGLARLQDRWQGSGNRGERFRDPTHLYADDLDLFGAGGLFELLATSRTAAGDEVLAGWLLTPATTSTIRARQEAVAELAPRLDLREDLAVLGPDFDRTVQSSDLQAWAGEPLQLQQRWPRIVLPLAAAVSVALIAHWIWTATPPDWLLPALVAQGLLALPFRRAAHHVAHAVEARDQELRLLALLIERIECETVASPLLTSLHQRLRASGHSPAEEIHRLARLVEILESGHNPYFVPFSALLLLRTQLAFAVERWRARCGPHVADWLAIVAEYEALSALSTYAAEHPQDVDPVVEPGPPRFDADALAHPLLSRSSAVANDVSLGGNRPHLLVVSGSNMSGKSTLLRTVGLNAVLAQAGARVRAERLAMSPLAIGATLRIQDSLQAGRSRFYAEITRISEIVKLTNQPTVQNAANWTGVLFLLDELLSGTNSHDRLQGATGILRGLLSRDAIGLATTHDLALTAIADRLAPQAANVHFDDRFEEGVLTFDYRIKPGVVQSSNAIALMRAVGLDV
jgi:hypothetical protein